MSFQDGEKDSGEDSLYSVTNRFIYGDFCYCETPLKTKVLQHDLGKYLYITEAVNNRIWWANEITHMI